MQKFRKSVHIILGIFFVICGIFGLVLPLLNGTILLIIGLIILSLEFPSLEKRILRYTEKNKTIHLLHIKLERLIRKVLRK